MLRQLEAFAKNYEDAMAEIQSYLHSNDETKRLLTRLVEVFLDTDANPYSFCPKEYAESFYSAQRFSALINALDHAMYDDGDVTFFLINGEPRFGFFNQYDANDEVCLNSTEKHFKKTYNNDYRYEVVSCEDWIREFLLYHCKEVRRFFIDDAARFGIDFAVKHNSTYAKFDPAWEDDPAILAKIDALRSYLGYDF